MRLRKYQRGFWDVLIPAAASLIGGVLGNESREEQTESTNAANAQQFATRYQTTVKDMEAAGLNPMLAYQQGGGAPIPFQTPQIENVGAGVGSAMASAGQFKLATAQTANVEADTENKRAQGELLEAQAAQARSSAGLNVSGTELNRAQVDKVRTEINKLELEAHNLGPQREVLFTTANMLRHQADLMAEQGLSQVQVRAHLRAQISELLSQVDINKFEAVLKGFDMQAAQEMGNVGRSMGQLKPIFELLLQGIGLMRPRGGGITINRAR